MVDGLRHSCSDAANLLRPQPHLAFEHDRSVVQTRFTPCRVSSFGVTDVDPVTSQLNGAASASFAGAGYERARQRFGRWGEVFDGKVQV
jgi:hypothetical protein